MTKLPLSPDPVCPENPWLMDHFDVHDDKSAHAVFGGLGHQSGKGLACSCVNMPPSFRIPATGDVINVDGVYRDCSYCGTFFNARCGEEAAGVLVYPVFRDAVQLNEETVRLQVSYLAIIVLAAEEMVYEAHNAEFQPDKIENTNLFGSPILDHELRISVSKLFKARHVFA